MSARRVRSPGDAVGDGLALVVLTGVAAVVLVVADDVWRPGRTLTGFLAPMPLLVPVYGPVISVVAAVALVLAGCVWFRARRAGPAWSLAAAAVAVLDAAALVAITLPVADVVTTTVRAGGSIDPLSAVALPQRTVRAPDLRTVFTTTAEGTPLHLSVWRPTTGTASPGDPDPAAIADPAAAPVIVWVHGGGWVGGTDLGQAAALTRWADRGWLVVSVEYGLDAPGHPTWDTAGPQVACALGRVASDAAALGGDPGRIVLGGDSAGGQLAVSVAYHAASHTQPSSCGAPVPVPRAVAVEYPAVDLVDGYEHGARSPVPQFDARWLAATYTGGSPAQVPERYRAISGTAALTPQAPPTLVVGAGRDSLVPLPGLQRFVAAARAGGVDATLVTVPFADHAFDVVDGSLGAQAASSVLRAWAAGRVGAP
ncbi:alpha/beta hydrolase [Actinomycetospora endophytica]|uniref:Alpha/beta hydrolase n=1 Tax=Actinomycetospora endophytica TaxID=2291215 RepID=A0ABS8PBZ4_9PSEU|nr:alpha/beta hydrolase [Actinomycetospora endophytica]MCD2195782.1 alpha/beta hydrolase [Actinomycetospora endophytica]